jgi:hypothetical protein
LQSQPRRIFIMDGRSGNGLHPMFCFRSVDMARALLILHRGICTLCHGAWPSGSEFGGEALLPVPGVRTRDSVATDKGVRSVRRSPPPAAPRFRSLAERMDHSKKTSGHIPLPNSKGRLLRCTFHPDRLGNWSGTWDRQTPETPRPTVMAHPSQARPLGANPLPALRMPQAIFSMAQPTGNAPKHRWGRGGDRLINIVNNEPDPFPPVSITTVYMS